MTTADRYQHWQRRAMVGQLGVWGEHWTDVSTLPDFPAWQELARAHGREATADYLSHRMTRGFLSELLYAAGGVEHEFGRIREALEQAQRWYEKLPKHDNIDAKTLILIAPSLQSASDCFVQLLMWARAVQERTLRRSQRPPGELGLLPALEDGPLKEQVAAAKADLDIILRDARLLSNYGLHAGAIPGGGTSHARLCRDGKITMLAPDTRAVVTWEAFTYEQELDIRTYSDTVMTAVAEFIDEVLDAFEEHRPERVGPLPRLEENLPDI